MEGIHNTYQFQLARVADCLLCSLDSYVRYSKLQEFLPTAIGVEETDHFQNALKFDEFDRFCYREEDGELFIGLKRLSDLDRRVQKEVEWWRVCIAKNMEHVSAPMELSRIAVHVERPSIIPRGIKLKDVLHADSMNRFRIHGPPTLPLVSLRVSADELNELMALWRTNVYNFLYPQRRDFTLTAIGQHVTRPGKLSDKQIKLIEVLKSDPEERFFLKFRSPTDTVVRITLSKAHRAMMEEKWRVGVRDFLSEQHCAVSLTDLGANVRRPSIHLGAPTTLRSVLVEDPQGRFMLIGSGSLCQVRLSGVQSGTRTLLTDSLLRYGSTTRPNFHAPVIGERLPAHMVRSQPVANKGLNSFHEAFQFEDLEVHLSGDEDLWGSKSPATASPSAPSRHSVLSQFDDFHDSVLEDFAVSSLSYSSPVSVGTELSASFVSRRAQPSPPGLCSPSVGVIGPPAVMYQASPSSALDNTLSHLSPLAGVYSPPSVAPHPDLYSSSSSSLDSSPCVTPRSSTPDSHSASLSDWLPLVLADFSSTLVDSFVTNLSDEGFLCVRDLAVAKSLGQLSSEYLAQLGLKVGHCNRIFAQLPKTQM